MASLRRLLLHTAPPLACALLAAAAHAQTIPANNDTSASFEKRAQDLLDQMTFAEKAGQLTTAIQAIPRLGIPACRIGTEALHGVQGRTIFPDGMALAAMFDPSLLQSVADAISDDARLNTNPGAGGTGLFLWCPTVNMARDPRWGRNLETYGEDPYLTSVLGAAYVRGLQGDHPRYLKAVATPKHFVVYSQEAARQSSNAIVSERALREYYLPAFEGCIVAGKAQSIMSAYNAINGVPCSANDWLLTTVLRDEWKFDGAVVTDSGAVPQIRSAHKYVLSDEEATAVAINSGVDIITNPQAAGVNAIIAAESQNLFRSGAIDRAVKNSLLVRFRLGVFDPPDIVPQWQPASSAAQRSDLALEAAREAVVLLQNNPIKGFGIERLLPLDLRRISSIAVVGNNANLNILGSYSQNGAPGGPGNPNSPAAPRDIVAGTFAGALRAAVGDRITIRYTGSDVEASKAAARAADVVIFVGGLDTRMEKTGTDRSDLNMPPDQRLLLGEVTKVNPLTVALLTGGSAIALDGLKDTVPAIVMGWYDGDQGPKALVDVLFGRYNPAGRLPITFYRAISDLPSMADYEVTSGRTYMYLKSPATFPFGHGLSYTAFEYRNLQITPGRAPGDPMNVSVEVANTGPLDGDEVVQIYVRAVDPKVVLPRPIKQLAAFQRVTILHGQTQTVRLEVAPRSFAYWDSDKHRFAIEPGPYEILAASSSEDIRQRAALEFK